MGQARALPRPPRAASVRPRVRGCAYRQGDAAQAPEAVDGRPAALSAHVLRLQGRLPNRVAGRAARAVQRRLRRGLRPVLERAVQTPQRPGTAWPSPYEEISVTKKKVPGDFDRPVRLNI